MRTIVFLDTVYPEVLRDGKQELFGTSFFYSAAFKKMGWDAYDIIGNGPNWHVDKVQDHILLQRPDIVYCQDLCYLGTDRIQKIKNNGTKVIGQISSKWPGDDVIRDYDILFSSFPHYIPRFEQLGVKGHFLPIAFGEQVLDYVNPVNRDIDISFVGGLGGAGEGGYWSKGTDLFEAVAREFPSFKWWGYFIGNIANYPNLSRSFNGPAWGIDQYQIYARSKIVVNRHGEVAEGYSNNMRMFEATGMGALLATEWSKNIDFYFNPTNEVLAYTDTKDLLYQLSEALRIYAFIGYNAAEAGQARTMKDHTYSKRLAEIEPFIARLIQ